MELNLEGLKIEHVDIAKEIQRSFIDYSVSVIVGRALPDVRDGLKPVHRRILYAMYEAGLTSDKPFRKSATTVGDVLGHYHPHGDAAVYDAMVRLAQSFSMRYPLVEGHGNFGNIDGDGAAAYRYTEARMAKMANEMLADIEKDVVDFTPNFDNSRKEPVVMPCRFPNLLVNGSVGIAVGMATNIPPHNLIEVIDAVEYLADHRNCEVRDLMQFIKGPDFPTYGKIYGTAGIEQAYLTGRGKVLMRAKTHFEEKGKRTSIIVDEIPYQVNKSNLVKGIADLVKDKRIEGISDLRDESCKGKIRIVIDLKLDANPEVILNLLFKYSQLQETFAINMLALVDNVPKTLNLKQMLTAYLLHQEEVVRRRIEFDLKKARARLHILEGYKIAIDNIEEVIRIIRSHKTVPEAKAALIARFELSDLQGQAIVDMPLGRLAGLEIEKILEEMEEKRAFIEKYEDILSDEAKLLGVLKEDLDEVRRRFGDARRTVIEESADDIVLEDLIEKHKCVITITHAGYIKRQRLDEYEAQKRGGKGMNAMKTKEEDSVRDVFVSHSHNFVFFFSNKGKLYARKCYMIPESGSAAKGTNLVNILPLEDGEKITAFQSESKLLTDEYLTFVTKKGVIKRTALRDFASVISSKGQCRKNGIRAITLDEGDELLFVEKTDGSRHLIVAATNGLAARFAESQIRVMGRTARGVRAMRLGDSACLCGFVSIAAEGDTRSLVTITENGCGKRCRFEDFTLHHRGGKGMKCQTFNEKTGQSLVGIAAVEPEDDLLIIVSNGKLIRIHAADISEYSRTAAGVKLVNLQNREGFVEEGVAVAGFQRVINDGDLEKEAEEANESDEVLPETDPDAENTPAEPVDESEAEDDEI